MLATRERLTSPKKSYSSEPVVHTYDMTNLIKKWEREELTNEQAIGQLLLYVQMLTEQVTELKRRSL